MPRRQNTVKASIAMLLTSLIPAVLLAQCSLPPAPEGVSAKTPTAFIQAPGDDGSADTIVSDALVRPRKQMRLSYSAGGRIQTLSVSVGEPVKAGQVLSQLDPTDLQYDVDKAQASLDMARAQFSYSQQAVKSSQSDLAVAKVKYDQVKQGAKPEEIAVAKADLEKASAALQQAQTSFDKVKDHPEIGMLPQSLALQQATIEYNRAKALYDLRSGGATKLDFQTAEAEIERAQIHVEMNKADLQQVGARVEQAELVLEQAKTSMAKAKLIAPWDGVITALYYSEGEMIQVGMPVVQLADLSRWQVDTNAIGELSVGRIKIGQEANITINAFPGQKFRGVVSAIGPSAIVQHGDTTYTVTIDLDSTALSLRWGMTARTAIDTRK